MLDIHYSDALLTAIFIGGFGFTVYTLKQFNDIRAKLFTLEIRLLREFSIIMKGSK